MNEESRVVLHVDDDPQLLRIVKVELEKRGYTVFSLEDPSQAMEKVINSDCRVVLLDIDMPGIGGMDLLKQIKQVDGGIQVIMLTGLNSMTTILETMRHGAEACLLKPIVDYSDLDLALQAAFAKLDGWWKFLQQMLDRKQQEKSTACS